MPRTTIFAALLAASPLAAQDMLGVSYSGSIYSLDSQTGATEVVAPGLFGHNCMARDEAGDLWTISRNLLGTPVYYLTRIDPASLAVEVVAVNRDVRALADAGNGELFSLEYLPGNYQLFRVDTTTGARTFIGATGEEIEGMAMHQGELFVWSSANGLGTLDPNSGAFTDVGGPSGNLQWLAVRSDGELIGGGTHLYTIDTSTGALTNEGPLGAELRGAETTGMAVPFGQGCNGVELRLQGSLRAGTVMTTVSTGYPSTGATVGVAGVVIVGASDSSHQNAPLPLDLDPLLGTNGCSLYASVDASAIGFTTGGAAPSFFFPVALPPGLAHETFFVQHAAFDFNGDWFWSNGVRLRIGN